MILSKMESKEMGLKLFASNVEPPLCKGRTFATLRASGKIPVSNDTLMIWQIYDIYKLQLSKYIHDWINSRTSRIGFY